VTRRVRELDAKVAAAVGLAARAVSRRLVSVASRVWTPVSHPETANVSGEQGVTTMRCRDRGWRPDAVQGLERRGIFEPVHKCWRFWANRPLHVDLCGQTRAVWHPQRLLKVLAADLVSLWPSCQVTAATVVAYGAEAGLALLDQLEGLPLVAERRRGSAEPHTYSRSAHLTQIVTIFRDLKK
jgi:hypothetical protein